MTTHASSIAELRAVLSEAAQTPSQAAAMADLVPDLIRRLPPERAELATRDMFHLGTDTELLAVFQNVSPSTGTANATPEVIEIPYDIWIRGCAGYALNQLPGPELEGVDLNTIQGIAQGRGNALAQLGSGGRPFFEVNWRLDGKQGFVQRGASGEIFANATGVVGTGKHPAAMDWQLQKDQTIEVRIRNIVDQFLPPAQPGFALTDELFLVVVVFYGLRLPLRAQNPRTSFGR